MVQCPECKGHGTVVEYDTQMCMACFGTGRSPGLLFADGQRDPCSVCKGTGRVRVGLPKHVTCRVCHGRGTIYEK